MYSSSRAAERMREIVKELDANPSQSRVAELSAKIERIEIAGKNYSAARRLAGSAHPYPYGGPPDAPNTPTGVPFYGGSKSIGPRWNPPSPLAASEEQMHLLWKAAKDRLPSFSIEVGGIRDKAIGADNSATRSKAAIAEYGTGPGGSNLLPSVIRPDLTQSLLFEPNRLFSEFPGMTIDAPSIEYLVHSSNTNPAAAVAELGTKPDLGMNLTVKTATPVKIAALATVSMEALDDFDYFQQFVPQELQRAVINAETAEIVSGSGTSPHLTGILNTSGILTRAVGIDTPLDAIQQAFNDIRVGSSFGTVDLVAMHPTTWSFLRRQKDNYGRYLLSADPATGQVNTIWGARVVTNTMITAGTVLAFDSSLSVRAFTRWGLTININQYGSNEWVTNAVSFRCEERIAIGVLRPSAVVAVTGVA